MSLVGLSPETGSRLEHVSEVRRGCGSKADGLFVSVSVGTLQQS